MQKKNKNKNSLKLQTSNSKNMMNLLEKQLKNWENYYENNEQKEEQKRDLLNKKQNSGLTMKKTIISERTSIDKILKKMTMMMNLIMI